MVVSGRFASKHSNLSNSPSSTSKTYWSVGGDEGIEYGGISILGFCRSCGEPELFQIRDKSSYTNRHYKCKCGGLEWWACRPVPKNPGTDKRCTECTHRFFCGTVDVKQFARRFEMTVTFSVTSDEPLSTREKKLLAKKSRVKKHGKNTGEVYKNSVLKRAKKNANVA